MYTVSSPHTRMRSPGTEDSNLGRTGGLFSQYDRDPSSKPIFCLQNIKCKINELLLFGGFFLGGGVGVFRFFFLDETLRDAQHNKIERRKRL